MAGLGVYLNSNESRTKEGDVKKMLETNLCLWCC